MAGTVERLQFLVTSDSAQARGDLGKLNQSASASMSGIGKLQEAFKLGAGIGAGTTAVEGVIGGLQKLGGFALSQFESAIGAASDLQQSAGSVRAVFGSASVEIEKFGRTSAQSVGLSTAAFERQSAILGALLQNLGFTGHEAALTSNKLVQVAADLGAAFNLKTADATLALSALLRGEFDTIEKFGIKIKQADVDARVAASGMDISTQATKNNAQAVAALAILQDQAGNSANAFADKENTLAGQQQRFTAELENARAELGTALLPAMTELVKIGRDLIPVIEGVATGVGLVAEAAEDAAKPVGKLVGLFSGLLKILPSNPIKGLFGGMSDEEFNRLVAEGEATKALADKTALLAEKSVLASAATRSLADKMVDLEKASSALLDSFIGADSAQSAFFKTLETGSSSAGSSAKKIERAYRSIEDAQRSLTDSQKELEESLIARFVVGLGATSDEITLGQIAERDSTRGLADAKRDLADAQSRLNKLREVDKAGLLDAEAAYIQAQRDFVDAEKTGDIVQLNRAKADLLRTEKALSEQRDPSLTGDLAQAEQDVAAAQDAVTTAEIDAKRSRKDLNDLINSGKEGSLDLAEANKQVEAAQRRVVDSERALVDAQDALTESASGLGGSVKNVKTQFQEGLTAADKWLQKLITNKATPEEFSEAVAKIYGSLKNVADQAGETGNLDTYLSKISAIYAQIRNISGFGNFAPGGFSNDPANAFQSLPETKIVMNLNGREFGAAVVEGLLAYQSANGSVPIRVTG